MSGLGLETGLAFEMTDSEAAAEILILWSNLINDLGETRVSRTGNTWNKPMNVTFKSNPGAGGWFFGYSNTTHTNQYHFFTTALHEVGHTLGLYEQDDTDDVMYFQQGLTGPEFDMIDQESEDGAEDLYSIPLPEPPTPKKIHYPENPYAGGTVTFDASASIDLDGFIVNYTWNFGDDTSTLTETNPIVTHVYTRVGVFQVTLTCTDDDGLKSTITQEITISGIGGGVTISIERIPIAPEVAYGIAVVSMAAGVVHVKRRRHEKSNVRRH